MSVVEAKASSNGIVRRITRRGIVRFAFGEDGLEFPVDIRATYDQWREIDWEFRNEQGELPKDKWVQFGQNRLNFVQAIVNDAYATFGGNAEVPQLSSAEAEAFTVFLGEEVDKLRDFFSPKKDDHSSSPENSETRINFSQ